MSSQSAYQTSSNSSAEQPYIMLISLGPKPWFDRSYEGLIAGLLNRAKLLRARKPDQAITCLASNRLDAVLVTDPAITESKHSTVLDKLKEYVSGGGRVIFGCLFTSFIHRDDLSAFFTTHFGLPWKSGSYHRTTVYLNRDAVRNMEPRHLVQEYSQKAVFLKNVVHGSALYIPSSQSMKEIDGFPAERIEDLSETPVAWARFGEGWIGYIGDVNCEEGSDRVILSMCG